MREICLYVYIKILNSLPSLAHFHTREFTCEENAKLQIMEWEDTKVEYSMSPLEIYG